MEINIETRKSAHGSENYTLVAGDRVQIIVRGETELDFTVPAGMEIEGAITVAGEIKEV